MRWQRILYVRNAYGLFTAAMAKYFPDSVFRVTLPQKTAPEIRIPTMEQISAIHQECKGSRFELPFLMAVWLGLRTSEIRGLTWDCIDGDILTIKQALVEGENGPSLKQPKTCIGAKSTLLRCLFMPGKKRCHSPALLLHFSKLQLLHWAIGLRFGSFSE